jgi:hypothetical protein
MTTVYGAWLSTHSFVSAVVTLKPSDFNISSIDRAFGYVILGQHSLQILL